MDITIRQLEHRYGVGTPFAATALKDVNLFVDSGTFLAVVGHTGSGKSTLVQHLNGLLKPTSGSVTIGERTIRAGQKAKHLKSLRQQVGMVFQYPEHQLFEETVEKDICFGPLNFGVEEGAAQQKAREVAAMVGLDERFLGMSPFDLSGGQKRRAAIAGVLALEPSVLILDEPTAGLDPRGQREMMTMFARLHREKQLTTLLVTHNMADVAAYADDVLVMHEGTTFMRTTPQALFADPQQLQALGLDIPETAHFIMQLEDRFGRTLSKDRFSVEGVVALVKDLLQKERGAP